MSVTLDGVKFVNKPRKPLMLLVIFSLIEIFLSILLVISLAAHILFPKKTEAVQGVSAILSYQGRLTDANGNPLGGSGTDYCFRFSFYDAPSGGNKLWPSGTPTTATTTVTNGVFNIGIGEADDLSTFDFSTSSTIYLNVEVNTATTTCTGTWETLSPRQRIDAVAYARETFDLWGGEVRVGTGIGVGPGSQKLVKLDVVNVAETIGGSCTVNGALWYNSNNTRALVCNNGTIMAFGQPATSTIVAIGVDTGTPVSAGTVVFSSGGNVTFGLAGSTITASAPAGGGGGVTLSYLDPFGPGAERLGGQVGNAQLWFMPLSVPVRVEVDRCLHSFVISLATGSTNTVTLSHSFGLYSKNGNTLSFLSSWSGSIALTLSGTANSASYSGHRQWTYSCGATITPGMYWVALWSRTSGSALTISNLVVSNMATAHSGYVGSATNASYQFYPGQGSFSASVTTAMPASVAFSDLRGSASGNLRPPIWFMSKGTIQ